MAKKSAPKKNKEIKKAEVGLGSDELRELGMIMDRLAVQSPEGESLDNCLRSLRNTLHGREALTVALIEALGKHPSEVSFRAFTLLKEMELGGVGARVVKQTAYRFAQQGFVVPSVKPDREVALVARETRQSVAYMVMEDEPCFLVSALVYPSGISEPMALVAYYEESFAQLHFDAAPSSSKGFKAFIERTSKSSPSPVCEIPIWHAAGLIFEMLAWSTGNRPALSCTFKRILDPFREAGRKPYAYEVLRKGVDPAVSLLDSDVAPIVKSLPLRWLFFSEEELKPWREAIVTANTSVLVVSDEMKYQRVDELIRKAADALCVADKRLFMQRFLEEGALWLHLTHRAAAADLAWMVAQHLASGSSPGESPLVVQLIAASLHRYWPQDFKADMRSPQELRETSGLYGTTDSGIIIPR
ncbi:MAG: hypothetical protein AB9873_01905 [Syntrophobacteraceae bacterium]